MIHAVSKIRRCGYQFLACIDTSAKPESSPHPLADTALEARSFDFHRLQARIGDLHDISSILPTKKHVSGFCSLCHDTGSHIATKCVSNDGLCDVKRCQSGVDHLQTFKHVCKQVSK